jgi:hypothetical protein
MRLRAESCSRTDVFTVQKNIMRSLIAFLLLAGAAAAPTPVQPLPTDDAVRLGEFYRLASRVQDQVWPGWDKVPAPLMLITEDAEFLTHYPAPPKEFARISDDLYSRARQFPINLQATFPAFGATPVIVVGEPKNTESKTSTPWLVAVMHEHFHQLQDTQPGYYAAVAGLGLSRGDETGMWMLNYPFPYEKPEIAGSFSGLCDLLFAAATERNDGEFAKLAKRYIRAREKFVAQLSADDHKYFGFQVWQEGIARYTQIRVAETAASYQPSEEYAALPDFESFASYAARVRGETLDELKKADLAKQKRLVFYALGATEGLLLDRLNPEWKGQYFQRMLSTDSYFDAGR